MAKKQTDSKSRVPARSRKPGAASAVKKHDKPLSKSKLKHQSKSTKHQIDKLNADVKAFDDVRSSLLETKACDDPKKQHALDYRNLKSDLQQHEDRKSKNKVLENDISKQLEMLTGIEL